MKAVWGISAPGAPIFTSINNFCYKMAPLYIKGQQPRLFLTQPNR